MVKIRKSDKNFKKEVDRAKRKYRSKRRLITTFVAFIVVVSFVVFKIIVPYIERYNLEKELAQQEQKIEELKKEAKVNEIFIAKLRDPNFIIDMVHQHYYMGYEGETIFNIQDKDNFLKRSLETIRNGDLDAQLASIDPTKLINDENISEFIKKREEDKRKEEEELEKIATRDDESSSNEESSSSSTRSTESNRPQTTTAPSVTSRTTQATTRVLNDDLGDPLAVRPSSTTVSNSNRGR